MTQPANTHKTAETEVEQPGESRHRLEEQRRENRAAISELGLSPYGARRDGILPIDRARGAYDEAADREHQEHSKEAGHVDRRPVVVVAGRIMLHRDNGKLIWMQLRDHTGDIQIAASKRDCEEIGFMLGKACDLGDVLIAEGPLMRTRTGEITIWASKLAIGAKSLAPPPEKWAGLQDAEMRYRKRYIDLYATPETMRVAALRSRIIARIRRFFDERDFLEVETPVLQPQAGGAAARPFTSTLNAMDMTVYMRIATELHLKRLLVGGMPRVYEIGRIFRNEGIDRQHNPEFTSIEVYEAFGNYETMLEHTERLLRELAHYVAVTTAEADVETGDVDPASVKLPFGDLEIDYGSPFARVTYAELFERALGFAMTDVEQVRRMAKERGLKHEGLEDIFVVNELFEEVAEKSIDAAKPTFVMDYPAALSPLTRPKMNQPELAERWDLFIGGMEIGPAYTELNDPDIQEAKFREQFAGMDEEEAAYRALDEDFIEALKVGMPPAGGLGLGIDRIVMLLTNQRSIRDVILFPFMRPVAGSGEG